jgi:hypothetical protein
MYMIFNQASSYFLDETNDFTKEGITDFLVPILESADIPANEIENLCNQLSNLHNTQSRAEDGNIRLEESMQMETTVHTIHIGKAVGDIRHGMSNKVEKSIVDQRKLRNQERKIEEKRQKRLFNGQVIPSSFHGC